jgi:lipopolysaccharide transport system ATP-binding protein
VEKFIDTPVKFYSSGMKVRLGFSVAAHLNPEILIIDEVLAVGDYEFQAKCLGKMEDVSKNQGRTVIFVSHNLGAVQNLCSQSLLLKMGKIEGLDLTSMIIKKYLGSGFSSYHFDLESMGIIGQGNQKIKLKSLSLTSDLEVPSPVIAGLDFYVVFQLELTCLKLSVGSCLDFRIDNQMGQRLLWFSTRNTSEFKDELGELIFKIPCCPLVPDEYVISVFIYDGLEVSNWYPLLFTFRVEESAYFKNGLVIPQGQSSIIYPFEIQII